MKCPRCGADNPDTSAFCTSCGGKLGDARLAPAAAATQQAPPQRSAAQRGAAPDALFNFNKLLFNQKLFRIREMYHIFDENGAERFFARRTFFALRRHVTIFADSQEQNEILKILQENIFMFFVTNFSLVDPAGNLIARLRRRTIMSILRRTWDVLSPDGTLLGNVLEDSWGKAIIRRFGPFGEWFKTDFNFVFGGRIVGKYIRKWTIGDKYVLDMSEDTGGVVDRRIALAMGVLLDAAEGR